MYGNGLELEYLMEARLKDYAEEARNMRVLRELRADPRPRPAGVSWVTRCARAIQAPTRRFRVAGG
jgi:hypothetical protein